MKKKLLSEAQVRRFMGLAGINPLNEMSHYNRDDDMSNEAMYQEGLMEEEDMAGDEMAGDEMPGAPMDGDDLPDEAGEADVEIDQDDLGDIKSALDTLQDKLAPLLDQAGGEIEGPPEDEEGPEGDMPMGDEEEENLDDELGDVDVEPTEAEKQQQTEEIVNEVARRVAKRIVEAKRAHNKMNEALGRKK